MGRHSAARSFKRNQVLKGMLDAKRANARQLASLAGISEDEAAQKLDLRVRITAEGEPGAVFSAYLRRVVGLTVSVADEGPCHVAVAVNGAAPVPAARTLYMRIDGDKLVVNDAPIPMIGISGTPPDIGLRVAACYAAGVVIKQSVGDLIRAGRLPFEVSFAKLGITHAIASTPINLSGTALVGAGGVGSGFLWGLEATIVTGELDVVDPKVVAGGNFNRHLHFLEEDLEQDKATIICQRAYLPSLKLVPFVGTFDKLVEKKGRVKRAVVTVDSRGARRGIQNDMPLEVLDASTTEVSAVVVNSHTFPTQGGCLACIYKHIISEDERVQSVADGLGITLDEAKLEFITPSLARKLAERHTGLNEEALVGTALNTLYREKCGEKALHSAPGKQTLAPFAFVSVLAGALLALQLMRVEAAQTPLGETDYMQLNPWFPPHGRRQRHSKEINCEFCSNPNALRVMREVWSDALSVSGETGLERTA
jgi:molybdopterin/thiamine biosynthesis adenylyltransferase